MKRHTFSGPALAAALGLAAGAGAGALGAAELEVTHWWTSGGEAKAVKEFADAFDATGNTWVDGAIAGSGDVAKPIIVSRLVGGDPMGATQFNHGRQAEELVEAGLFRDLTELAEKEGWRDVVNPSSLLDGCTLDGKIYCVPVNIHSAQWLWLSNAAFESAGVEVPTNWDEFVAAGPALREAGITPLAIGSQPWQATIVFQVLLPALAGTETYRGVFEAKDPEIAAGEDMRRVFEALGDARELSRGTTVQDWNQATNLVITGQAGGQIMGDWAQGEFANAGQEAGTDYGCLPGLGVNEVIGTGGDAFYFPVLDDQAKSEAQLALASTFISPATQVAFNLAKGSLPVRGDVDLQATNECMQKGLEILKSGNTIPDLTQLLTQDTNTQINDLIVQFFADDGFSPEDAQEAFASLIERAD